MTDAGAGPASSAVRDRAARVAARSLSYRYYRWDWGEAIALDGQWQAWRFTGAARFRDFVERTVRAWIGYAPDPWYHDHTGPACAVVELWRDTGDLTFLAHAKRLGAHLAALPRNEAGARFLRPDLPDRASLVWVDSMQTDPGFLCSLGAATGERRWFDLAAGYLLGHIRVLQDAGTHLFHHSYDDAARRPNGVHWARGNGWALLGLVQCLEGLPADHPAYPAILQSLQHLAHAVVAAQDGETALWHTVLDHPDTYREASASLMLSNGLIRASRKGWLPSASGDAGRRAWRALWDDVDNDGVVRNVSARTPSRSDPAEYNRRPVGGHYPWGQGAYLLTAATDLGL